MNLLRPIVCALLLFCVGCTATPQNPSPIEQLKKTFQATLLDKNFSAIPAYYHPQMRLYTNGKEMNYQEYIASHKGMYVSSITHTIRYDEETLIEEGDKMAGRLWLTTQKPGAPFETLEVVLVVQFKENKVYRIWEVTKLENN